MRFKMDFTRDPLTTLALRFLFKQIQKARPTVRCRSTFLPGVDVGRRKVGYTTRIQNDRYHYLIFESVEYVTPENKDVHKIEFLPTQKVEVATFAMILF